MESMESLERLAEAKKKKEQDQIKQQKATEELEQQLEAERLKNDEEIQQMYRELGKMREENARIDRE